MRRLATLSLAVVGLATLGADAAAGFKPADGRYRGEYVSGEHGPGDVRLRVEPLRPGLHGVRLLRWSGELRCEGGGTERVDVPMTAARAGRTFSGFVTSPTERYRFTGRFTARDALEAKVRVRRETGEERCDTGLVEFVAHRVGR